MTGERVTVHRESFLNRDHELRDHRGAKIECDWDVVYSIDAGGRALHWAGMQRGDQLYRLHGDGTDTLVFVAGQKERPS
jgi:hypothetical protein